MKRFSFRLETLLTHRKNIEEKERNELMRLRSLLQQECNHLRDLHRQHHNTLGELAARRTEGADHGEVALFIAYMDRLKHEQVLSAKRITGLEKDVERQKITVVEATKQAKLIDTLRTKKHKEYAAFADKEEQKAVDEMVVVRYPGKHR
jgi:flagellar protein FliJ